jgi:hypothetical protein
MFFKGRHQEAVKAAVDTVCSCLLLAVVLWCCEWSVLYPFVTHGYGVAWMQVPSHVHYAFDEGRPPCGYKRKGEHVGTYWMGGISCLSHLHTLRGTKAATSRQAGTAPVQRAAAR